MLKAKLDRQSGFYIDLDAPPKCSFVPGDNIAGNIVLQKDNIITSKATLKVELTGIAKTQIGQSATNDQLHRTYRDEWHFLAPNQTTIFQGPLHISKGSSEASSWPFQFQIPTEPTWPKQKMHIETEGFISKDRDHEAHRVLPGSFFSSGGLGRLYSEGSIEYALQAWLHYKRGDTHHIERASWPIDVGFPVWSTTGQLYQTIKSATPDMMIQSQRLRPGMENASLSLKQNTQKLFGSSKIPEWHYKIVVESPSVVQLDNPVPLPITLQFISLPDKSSIGVKDVAPTVRINYVKMAVDTVTGILVPRALNMSINREHDSSIDVGLEKVFENLETPLEVTVKAEGTESVDIGSMFKLALHTDCATAGERQLNGWVVNKIEPDFVFPTIQRRNYLHLKINVTIAGETRTVDFKKAMIVLAQA
ncbi:uncharacterized protein N7496_001647 [Penicillium cataractarum]|uniref:Arrestin-like N-terminal domain-containing protein n=1 Tax=Penicillium cataractarum TaxID=2100454 RepID=A0A9W9VWR5_9EURO|nr:uncharacterized protein N7496_001647 [Penicillium cataractarum]KAJ5390579.1 hypothetical protein N7496_001647 [Penicillium cataractarum]